VYPAAYESVEFLKSVSRPYRDAIKQHTADTWNVGGDYSDPNYIPIRLPNAPNSQAPLSPDGPRNITRPTLRPKQAKGTIERQKYRGLPAGKDDRLQRAAQHVQRAVRRPVRPEHQSRRRCA
jgi:hypothetical protein